MYEPSSLFLLGLIYGTTVCSFSCLPYYGPYLIGSGAGFKDGVISSCAFAAGKLSMYSAFGGAAALLGHTLTVTSAHKTLMGLVVIAVAFTMPFVTKGGCRKRTQVVGKRLSMFALGIVSSFVPCPPLAAVLLLAAQDGDAMRGLLYGFCYGLGLTLSPILFVGGGFALISQRIRDELEGFAPYMQKISMAVMVVIALRIMR